MGKFTLKAARKLGIPLESAQGAARVVILPDEIYIENHLGIDKLTKTEVVVHTADRVIAVRGEGFSLCHLKRGDLRVAGTITSLSMTVNGQ